MNRISYSCPCRRRSGRCVFTRGWTLVEVLVAVCIVGILAGLVLPAASKAVARANMAKCQSNLRQIGVALNLYKADNGRLPQSWDGSAFWFNRLISGGYLDDRKVLACPAQKAADPYTAMNLNVKGGYGMTYLTFWYPAVSNTDRDGYFLATRLKKLSEWPIVIDADYPQVGGLENPQADSDRQQRFTARHGGMANLLMMDGHVEQARYGDKRWSQANLNDGTKY